MANTQDQIERISARLDVDSQQKARYLLEHGYGPTELVREGIELLYQQAISSKPPSVPAILKSLTETKGDGPADLSSRHKEYYKDKLIEKHTG